MMRPDARAFIRLMAPCAFAAAVSACIPDGVATPDDDEGFTIAFCADGTGLPVVGIAQQDGDNAWQLILPENGTQTYRFVFNSGRGAIAIKSYWLSVYYATPLQLEQFMRGYEGCGTKSVTGSIVGISPDDTVGVSLGNAYWLAFVTGPQSFELGGIRPGSSDLVAAARGSDVRYIVRAGLDLPDGAILAPLDFSSAEAIAATPAAVTVTDLHGDEAYLYASLGATGLLTRPLLISGSAAYQAVPAARLPAGVIQTFTIYARDGAGKQQRDADFHFADLADRTVTLGPRLADATVTVRTRGPFAFPTLEFPVQPQYGRWASANFDTGNDGAHGTSVFCSAEYCGGHASTWILTVPDLTSLPGFQPAWALQSGVPVSYEYGAGGATRPWPFGGYQQTTAATRPVNGDEMHRASRYGFMTP